MFHSECQPQNGFNNYGRLRSWLHWQKVTEKTEFCGFCGWQYGKQHALLNLGHAADDFPGHVFLLASAAKNMHLMDFFYLVYIYCIFCPENSNVNHKKCIEENPPPPPSSPPTPPPPPPPPSYQIMKIVTFNSIFINASLWLTFFWSIYFLICQPQKFSFYHSSKSWNFYEFYTNS